MFWNQVHCLKSSLFSDVGTPVKSGITFHRQSSSTSTVTKPSATPTSNHAPSVPLAPPSQRPKFTFNISPGNKGNKTESSTAKHEGKEKYDKNGLKEKFINPSTDSLSSETKSPISSLGKFSETLSKPDTSKSPGKSDGSSVEVKGQALGGQKDKIKETSDEGLPLRKENKEKKLSPKKPRPPPLFIPRPLVQGKGMPSHTRKLYLFVSCSQGNQDFYFLTNLELHKFPLKLKLLRAHSSVLHLERISPYSLNTMSSRQVTRIKTSIN